ncbi:hypothetical protein LCGC14_0709010 [marine sediment metagenome]|uniref:Tetratricopeptide repeat-containing protein n=2 Tax=root TaxID=1 RepID=A0A831QP22_9FLAO|nr:hypothetical protein [Pricia sp.]HEA20182.1 hypothetical protein [Pricia antarctica]
MPKKYSIIAYALGLLLIPLHIYAQEIPIPEPDSEIDIENSAEVFLEGYSDEFQEYFFEALKQKGIENYDKAINALLKCKKLDASNPVVDYELAKAHFAVRQYPLAEEYALSALQSSADNIWYANTLIDILERQGKSVDDLTTELPFDQPEFTENLASLYLKKGNYVTALAIIKKANHNSTTKAMTVKINDSIQKQKDSVEASSYRAFNPTVMSNTTVEAKSDNNPLEQYKIEMENLIQSDDFPSLQKLTEEALENYPAQPFFYYANGYALTKIGKHRDAIEALETALDYLIDDTSLENKIYQELVDANTAINDPVKANMYLRKIKPGF